MSAKPTQGTKMAAPLHAPSMPAGLAGAADDAQRRSRRRRRPGSMNVCCSSNADEPVGHPVSRRRRRRRASMALSCMTAAAAISFIPAASGHGYLETPRSRNLVAYQDKNYESPGANDPKPEDCPHCLNRGGSLAQCGVLFGEGVGVNWERNYDQPRTLHDEPMRPNVQGVYQEGSIIDVEVLATTHHKGHFEFSLCPIDDSQVPLPVPTEECFQKHKLEFVSDELYGAPKDPNYPHRAYIAPASIAHSTEPVPGVQPVVGEYYKMKFQLPEGVAGDLVLLQWYYLTANSCKHEGYAEYPFPEEWGKDVDLYPGLPDCGDIPPDGNGVPEQFWNCAEIVIVGPSKASTVPLGSPVAPEARDSMEAMDAAIDATPRPTQAPTPWQPCQKSGGASYYEATEDCTGYYVCENGVQGQIYECPGGTQLYDEAKQMCNWADEVTCNGGPKEVEPQFDESGNPLPTKAPTPLPTPPPNALHEWDPNAHPRGHDKTIIGYYASWQWYDRNGLAEPAAFDFTKITRANFAFFQITEDGYIFGTDEWADPITLFGFYDWMAEEGTGHQYCSWDAPNAPPNCMQHKYEEGLIYLAHQAGAEVYPSIGGWSLSDPFPPMAANPEARANFARQCVELIKNYNFDGIDLDWEYPGYEPHSGTPEDTVNFNLLLDDLRAALDELGAETGRYYGLTAALPCGPSIIDNQDIAHVGAVLTELNLMTYDFHGSWNEKTGVNSPLYDQEDSPEFSVHGCVANWLEGGAPKEKINIGWAFYGRSFLGAQGLYEPHEGADDTMWWMDEGVPQYYNIMDKMNGMESYRDEQTMTQVAYGTTGMVSYDDPRAICDKTEYAQVHDLNGYIIWEISGDLMPDLSTPLLDAGNAKLLDPDLDCASLDLSTQINALISDAHPGSRASGGGAGGSTVIFYADHTGAVCLSDGLQPDWMQGNDLHTSLEDCCGYHFSWNANCVDDSPATPEPVAMVADAVEEVASTKMQYYPSSTEPKCRADGRQPGWMTVGQLFDTEEECCKKSFPSQDCLGKSVHVKATMFYPASMGSSWPDKAICLNDGKQPQWLKEEDMFATEEDCCEYNFPGLPCVGEASAVVAEALEEKPLVWYPSQSGSKCVRDGKQPGFLSADVMFETQEACCKHHYEWSEDCVTTSMGMGPSRPQVDEALPAGPLPASPTRRPTDHPTTSQPTTSQPTTGRPTRHPTPHPIRQTKRPTRHPMPRPTRFPTPHPTRHPTRRPTPPTAYNMIQTEATFVVQEQPDPTRRPTRKPSTRRPTRGTPSGPARGESLAASFVGEPANTAAYTTMPREEPSVAQYTPSKGQEQSPGNTIAQMLAQRPKKKAKAKGNRGNYVKGAKKKVKQMEMRWKKQAKKKAVRGKRKQGQRQKAPQVNAQRQQKKRQRVP